MPDRTLILPRRRHVRVGVDPLRVRLRVGAVERVGLRMVTTLRTGSRGSGGDLGRFGAVAVAFQDFLGGDVRAVAEEGGVVEDEGEVFGDLWRANGG